MLSDIGFNPYTSLLCTHDDQLDDHPQLVRKMVAASIRGWENYIQSPEEANRRIHQANPEMDLDILEYGAETLKPLVMDSTAKQKGVGTMSRARWQTLADQLVESEQLKRKEVHVEKAFTMQFLHREKSGRFLGPETYQTIDWALGRPGRPPKQFGRWARCRQCPLNGQDLNSSPWGTTITTTMATARRPAPAIAPA